jgi:hypothetical protein
VGLLVNVDHDTDGYFYQQQEVHLGVALDEKLNWNSHIDHRMQKAFMPSGNFDRENMGTETKGCALDIHFGD